MSTSKKAETILAGLLALLDHSGDGIAVQTHDDAELLVVGSQPIDGPVLAYAPFVRNTPQETQPAAANVWAGRFGQLG